jgi:hypothetical protein
MNLKSFIFLPVLLVVILIGCQGKIFVKISRQEIQGGAVTNSISNSKRFNHYSVQASVTPYSVTSSDFDSNQLSVFFNYTN